MNIYRSQEMQKEKAKGSKRKAKISKANSKKQAKGLLKSDNEASTKENKVLVDLINMPNSNEDSLETSGVQKTADISTMTIPSSV
ncbi:hypothetical protein ACOME3_005173 [Neoechinorhynchus agilis]